MPVPRESQSTGEARPRLGIARRRAYAGMPMSQSLLPCDGPDTDDVVMTGRIRDADTYKMHELTHQTAEPAAQGVGGGAPIDGMLTS